MILFRQMLGEIMRGLRLRQGCTITDLSVKAGVSPSYLYEVERGSKEASSEVLAAIWRALDTAPSQVFREVAEGFSMAGR